MSRLFAKRTRPVPAPDRVEHACADLDAMPLPFSPLITELLAVNVHTRRLIWLAQQEMCQEEFRLAAHAVIKHLLEAWAHQTGGRGSVEDLLMDLPAPRVTGAPGTPGPLEHGYRTGAGGSSWNGL
ncbi:hypothetical protein [Streptomyces violaceusniger]|uniref:Uncharacterized protein n=1 Tax=Streptomyces violaceusniger (strain Tu 4113) TaxID=653045 RepID=G2PH68_STRV4|nr:hypothetical protein [Streptomyces violaceusniger]AEM88714.1 hypothetical protein Strvi_9462 [Streptomyces violaceusniger Tu 4113]